MKTLRLSDMARSRVGLTAIAVVLSGAIAAACAFLMPSTSRATPAASTRLAWHDIDKRIEATGALRPTSLVHVGALVSGIIVSATVQPGDRVRAGQVIAAIDDAPFRLQLGRARALLRAAELRVDEQARQLRRQLVLQREGFVAPAAVEGVGNQALLARQDVRAAQADVESAQINLDHCRIVSPIAGTVLSREISAGQSVAAAFQVPDLFTIVSQLDRLEVVAMFAEVDLAHVAASAPATLSVPAYPGQEFAATVRRVLDTPETRQGLVMFPAILDVSNDRGLLRPGMTAYVRIRLAGRAHVLTVANAALAFARARDRAEHAAATGKRRLYVLRDGEVVPVTVRLGDSDDTHTEILPVDRLDERDDILTN